MFRAGFLPHVDHSQQHQTVMFAELYLVDRSHRNYCLRKHCMYVDLWPHLPQAVFLSRTATVLVSRNSC